MGSKPCIESLFLFLRQVFAGELGKGARTQHFARYPPKNIPMVSVKVMIGR